MVTQSSKGQLAYKCRPSGHQDGAKRAKLQSMQHHDGQALSVHGVSSRLSRNVCTLLYRTSDKRRKRRQRLQEKHSSGFAARRVAYNHMADTVVTCVQYIG